MFWPRFPHEGASREHEASAKLRQTGGHVPSTDEDELLHVGRQ